jgi:hypothetical protein
MESVWPVCFNITSSRNETFLDKIMLAEIKRKQRITYKCERWHVVIIKLGPNCWFFGKSDQWPWPVVLDKRVRWVLNKILGVNACFLKRWQLVGTKSVDEVYCRHVQKISCSFVFSSHKIIGSPVCLYITTGLGKWGGPCHPTSVFITIIFWLSMKINDLDYITFWLTRLLYCRI